MILHMVVDIFTLSSIISYCVVTVSDRSRELVEQYIRSQKER